MAYLEAIIAKRDQEEAASPFPPFDIRVCDGCSAGVRQIAQSCCALHDLDYWYGVTALDKLKADWGLAMCIWRYGWRRVTDPLDPMPYSMLPAWWLLGAVRGLAVALGGWGAFRKPHKRR